MPDETDAKKILTTEGDHWDSTYFVVEHCSAGSEMQQPLHE